MHTDDKKKYILVLREDPTQIVDDTKITPGAIYNFFEITKKILFKFSL